MDGGGVHGGAGPGAGGAVADGAVDEVARGGGGGGGDVGGGGVVGGVASRMTGEGSGSFAGEAGLLFTESEASFTESMRMLNMALGRVLRG